MVVKKLSLTTKVGYTLGRGDGVPHQPVVYVLVSIELKITTTFAGLGGWEITIYLLVSILGKIHFNEFKMSFVLTRILSGDKLA